MSIEAVRQVPEPRHICLEEGTLSEWLYEVLSPYARKVVVAAVSESRGPKDDRRDAFGLADDLRMGAIRRKVYKQRGRFGALGYRAVSATFGKLGGGVSAGQGWSRPAGDRASHTGKSRTVEGRECVAGWDAAPRTRRAQLTRQAPRV